MNLNNYLKVILLTLTLSACAGQNFKDMGGLNTIGSTILGSTGIVSGSQADALMQAGGKVMKGVEGLSDEQEYYLGRGVSATVFSSYPPLKNQAVNSYVNKVGLTLAAFSDKPNTFSGYHFIVLDTNEVNALSAPGGFVFITKGLLKLMPDEDALAAVLAHEVAHIVLNHGLNAIQEANLTDAFLILGKEAAASQGGFAVQELTTAFGDSVTDIASTLLTKGYSRSQEYDADEYAALLMQKTGYNTQSLVVMLQALEAIHKSGNRDDGWFATHPDPDDRIDEVNETVANAVEPTNPGQAIRAKRFQVAMKSLV